MMPPPVALVASATSSLAAIALICFLSAATSMAACSSARRLASASAVLIFSSTNDLSTSSFNRADSAFECSICASISSFSRWSVSSSTTVDSILCSESFILFSQSVLSLTAFFSSQLISLSRLCTASSASCRRAASSSSMMIDSSSMRRASRVSCSAASRRSWNPSINASDSSLLMDFWRSGTACGCPSRGRWSSSATASETGEEGSSIGFADTPVSSTGLLVSSSSIHWTRSLMPSSCTTSATPATPVTSVVTSSSSDTSSSSSSSFSNASPLTGTMQRSNASAILPSPSPDSENSFFTGT